MKPYFFLNAVKLFWQCGDKPEHAQMRGSVDTTEEDMMTLINRLPEWETEILIEGAEIFLQTLQTHLIGIEKGTIKPEAVNVDHFADLIEEYREWCKGRPSIHFGSADDHVFDMRLSSEDRQWLYNYVTRWEAREREVNR